MIFQNICFHNVEQMIPFEDGWKMTRLPEHVMNCVNEGIRSRTGTFSSGVELRMRLKGEKAVVRLRALPIEEAQVGFVYYGSFQGGWQVSSFAIGTESTSVSLVPPAEPARLRELTQEGGLPFCPDLIRLVLPYGTCVFLGVDGEVEPPRPGDEPGITYLAYGSSITHGSLALDTPHTYPFRIAQELKCDYLNLGFAGTAHLEKEMAEYAGTGTLRPWKWASICWARSARKRLNSALMTLPGSWQMTGARCLPPVCSAWGMSRKRRSISGTSCENMQESGSSLRRARTCLASPGMCPRTWCTRPYRAWKASPESGRTLCAGI